MREPKTLTEVIRETCDAGLEVLFLPDSANIKCTLRVRVSDYSRSPSLHVERKEHYMAFKYLPLIIQEMRRAVLQERLKKEPRP